MAELKVKPERQFVTLDHQGIYFTCHPGDFNIYFESITDEILGIKDCTIYYYEPDDEPECNEEYYMNLRQMRLFVIPVTRKFLEEESRAMRDFEYAVNHGIAVLPLMQENGLEHLFERKCGTVQFLEKRWDGTGRPYEEKLSTYINSILVSDDFAKKIRDEFDAYIFLSYRKKDRKYAQKLMELIHQDDLFRDVAIWYDEFLIPGEKFDSAIINMMKKSDLFTIAVTPNILEDGNYVIETEYKTALEEQKPILPAELVKTDKNELKNKLTDIPECVDAYDIFALSEALKKGLNHFTAKENESDPMHRYLIGCAYLSGIDVEKNAPKALELITGAAENGCTEAMRKLSHMYYFGDGVERNFDIGIQWLERAAKQAREMYEKSGNFEDGVNYLRLLDEFSKKQIMLTANYLPFETICIEAYELAGKLYMDSVGLEEHDIIGSIKIDACRHLALVYNSDPVKQIRYLIEANDLSELLMQNDESDATRGQRANCLGMLALVAADPVEQETYHKQTIAIFEELMDHDASKWASDFANAYYNFGCYYYFAEQYEEAESYYIKALDIWKEKPDSIQMASVYYMLGIIRKMQDRLEEAEAYYMNAVRLRETAVEEIGTKHNYFELAVSYFELGTINDNKKNTSEAKEWYRKSLDILENTDIGAVETDSERIILANVYYNTAKLLQNEGDFDEAIKYYHKANKVYDQCDTLYELYDIYRCAVCSGYVAVSLLSDGDIDQAKKHFAESIKACEVLVNEYKTDIALPELAVNHSTFAFISGKEGNFYEAEKHLIAAIKLYEELIEKSDSAQYRRELASRYEELSLIYKEMGLFDKQLECCAKIVELWDVLDAESGSAEDLYSLARAYTGISSVYFQKGNNEKAIDNSLLAIKTFEKIDYEFMTVPMRINLGYLHGGLGQKYIFEGATEDGLAHISDEIEIWKSLAKETGDDDAYESLAYAFMKRASFTRDTEMLRGAVKILSELSKKHPDVERYENMKDEIIRKFGIEE